MLVLPKILRSQLLIVGLLSLLILKPFKLAGLFAYLADQVVSYITEKSAISTRPGRSGPQSQHLLFIYFQLTF